jgi:hypothetical protein
MEEPSGTLAFASSILLLQNGSSGVTEKCPATPTLQQTTWLYNNIKCSTDIALWSRVRGSFRCRILQQAPSESSCRAIRPKFARTARRRGGQKYNTGGVTKAYCGQTWRGCRKIAMCDGGAGKRVRINLTPCSGFMWWLESQEGSLRVFQTLPRILIVADPTVHTVGDGCGIHCMEAQWPRRVA